MRRLWFVLLAVFVALAVLAMPAVAFAQTDAAIDTEWTWTALGTIAGAAAAATLVAQVLLAVKSDVSGAVVRAVMLVVAVALTELVALMNTLTLESGVVAFFVGCSAALAAMKGYETYKHGLNATVSAS